MIPSLTYISVGVNIVGKICDNINRQFSWYLNKDPVLSDISLIYWSFVWLADQDWPKSVSYCVQSAKFLQQLHYRTGNPQLSLLLFHPVVLPSTNLWLQYCYCGCWGFFSLEPCVFHWRCDVISVCVNPGSETKQASDCEVLHLGASRSFVQLSLLCQLSYRETPSSPSSGLVIYMHRGKTERTPGRA